MDNHTEIEEKNFVIVIVTIEGILLIIALIWGYLARINPFSTIYFNYSSILLSVFGALFLVLVNYLAINKFSKFIPFFKKLKEAYSEMAFMAANISIPGAIIISVASGFVEEFFFRGIVQVQFGIIVSSIIFGEGKS